MKFMLFDTYLHKLWMRRWTFWYSSRSILRCCRYCVRNSASSASIMWLNRLQPIAAGL